MRRRRTVLRDQARRGAGLGEHGDGAHVQVLRGVRHRFADGLGDGEPRARCAGAAAVASHAVSLSASAMMRAIMATASRGYLPLAVSAESMTASVPSKIALATSLASARVGRGFSIIDSSICVAVITGLRHSSARRMMCFWMSGTFSGGSPRPVAARHHHAVGDFQDLVEVLDRLRLLQLGDDRNIAARGGDAAAWRRSTSSARAHERDARRSPRRASGRTRRSSSSFSVSDGMLSSVPGRLMPWCSPSMPPLTHLALHVAAVIALHAQLDAGHRRAECARPASRRCARSG